MENFVTVNTEKMFAKHPTMASASDEEVAKTMQLIKIVFPQLKYDKLDLQRCSHSFTIKFYQAFVSEIYERVAYLLQVEAIIDEFDEIEDFEYEIKLYYKVMNIFQKMQYISISLTDFYLPNPDQMFKLFTVSIHFVMYLNEHIGEIYKVVDEIRKNVLKAKRIELLKERDTVDSNSRTLVRLSSQYEELTKKLEMKKKIEEQMFDDEVAERRRALDAKTEIKSLKCQTRNLEFLLKLVEDNEKRLQELVVSDEEFVALREEEQALEIQYKDLCNHEAALNIKDEVDKIKRLEDYKMQLQTVSFDSLHVELLNDLKQQARLTEVELRYIRDRVNLLETTAQGRRDRVAKLKRTLFQVQAFCDRFTNKIYLQKKQERICNAEKMKNIDKCKKLQKAISNEMEQMERIEEYETVFKTIAVEEFQKLLKLEREARDIFRNILKHTENITDEE